MTSIAIMQPTFLPWIGYFALIDQVERFVYLDDVQLSRQSWQTRNRLKGPDGAVMLSLPVARKPSKPLIMEAKLAEGPWREKLRATADHLLGRAPHGTAAVALLRDALDAAGDSLLHLNIGIIERICDAAGLTTPRSRASDLTLDTVDRTGRLAAICAACGADTYVSPPGAVAYLSDDSTLQDAEIDVKIFDYHPEEYPQSYPPFVSHLGAIDAFAHLGASAFAETMRAGCRPDLSLSAAQARTP
ncbi:hypothetical protein DXV76_11440 [Rhodobacteraceae bacterium CCMM004]|nr:hypothetical protein DXV76_11440 [Rhodobacteraceae bacterium CCMM004]